jgi:Putative lumazine-binding
MNAFQALSLVCGRGRIALIGASALIACATAWAQSTAPATGLAQGSAVQVIETFARAADRRDVEGLERVLHPSFRILFTVDATKPPKQLDRAQFLALVREGKIGGQDRQVQVSAISAGERFATAAARMEHKGASFDGVYALVEQEGRWWLLQEAVMMKTGAAR